MDLDQLQEKFGGISAYQVLVISVTSLLPLGTALMSQSSVFFSAVPDHRCAVPPIDDPNVYPNLTEENITSLTIPPGDSCRRYAYNLSACTGGDDLTCITNQSEIGVVDCDYGYQYDDTYYDETTVSEWDLLCGQQTLDSVANSLYFFGVFIGSAIVGPLMDWFGRKLCMLIMCCLLIVSGIACAFSPSYEVYIALRVVVASAGIPCFLAYYTYVCEISDKNSRTFVGAAAQWITSLSHVLLVGFAYGLRDWRNLCIAISLVPSTYIIIYFFIPRSPRWLISTGRENEAKEIVERFARSKKITLEEDDWKTVVATEQMEASSEREKYLVTDLFRPPMMRLVCCIIIFLWFTVSMVFYGLTLNVGTLIGDPYVNSALNAVAEVIGYALYYPLAAYFGRRYTSIFSFFMAGACCLTTMLLTEFANGNQAMIEGSRWVAILGKMMATIAFSLVYQYTAELFPTVARGTAISMGSMAARVGSMIMPFTLQLQQDIPWLTQTLFGSFGLLSAAFSFLLPDTLGIDLMASLEESENFFRKYMRFSAKLFRITGTYKPKMKKGKENIAYEEDDFPEETVIHNSKL